MTRAEAVDMLGVALDAKGLGGLQLGTTPVWFELAKGTLVCRALVYRFHAPAAPAVLAKLKQGPSETNAALEYDAASRALCLTRAYVKPVSNAEFQQQLGVLVAAALRWADVEIDRLFGLA